MTEDPRVVVLDGDDIMIVSTSEAMEIACRQAKEMMRKLAVELCSVQPMNTNLLDGLMFPIRYEPKS